MTSLTIGQLARQAHIGIETVRFYERRGLIEDPPRRESGYRQYSPDTVRQLRFIRRAKELGFTLDEVGELLQLRHHSAANRERVRSKALAKIDDIEQRIADLSRMQKALVELADTCASGDNTQECPILAALEGGEESDNAR